MNIRKNFSSWILAIRPKTLPAALAPVVLGLSLSSCRGYSEFLSHKEPFSFLIALLTLLCTLFLQISSNLINDYYDGIRGLDDESRLGPPRATALGLLSPKEVKRGFLFTLGLSFFLGIFLMIRGGTPIIAIGFFSLFFSWAYTAGPYPLSHYALGEVFAFLFFGPLAVLGTWYLQVLPPFQNLSDWGKIPLALYGWSFAMGMPIAALMGINNLRDRQTDQQKGKITLATLFGERPMRIFIFFLLSFPHLLAFKLLFSLASSLKNWSLFFMGVLFGSALFFLFRRSWKGVLFRDRGKKLNKTLAQTGQYLFLFSLIYSILLFSSSLISHP